MNLVKTISKWTAAALATVLPARVTEHIAPGVIAIKEGAWYTPDGDGTDLGGCGNVLSADRSAPCGATTYNTNQVEVALAAKAGAGAA